MKQFPELSCHCGAREDDKGQGTPRACWNCGKVTMTAREYLNRERERRGMGR